MVAKWLSKSERALESTATAAAPSSTTSAFSWLASAEICCRLLSKSGRRADPGSFSRKRSMTPIASSRCLRPMRSASGRFGSSRPAAPRPSAGTKSFSDFHAASTDPDSSR